MKIQGVEGGDDAARAIAASVWSLLSEGLRENVLAVSVPIARLDVMKSDRCNFFFFPFNVNANSSSSFGLRKISPRRNALSIEDIAFLARRGGWPAATMMEGEVALDQSIDYYDSVVDYDIKRVDGVRRDSQRARRLLRSFARNITEQVSYATYKADMASNDSDTLDEDTVADYIKALKKLYVVEDMEAWNPNMRSKAAIRIIDTRHIFDPSIATAALGIGPKDLINDLETFGLIFENMAVRDLRVYSEALFGKLYHYRDNTGLECDAVLHRRNGTYGLIEVKLGGETKIKEGPA